MFFGVYNTYKQLGVFSYITFSIKICKVLYTEYMNIIIIYKTFKIAYKFSNTEGKKYSLWISAAADRMDKYN